MGERLKDDPELLRLMLDDASRAPSLYRPTDTWQAHERRFLPYLERHGLAGFRRGRDRDGGRIFSFIGAADLVVPPARTRSLWRHRIVHNAVCRRLPGWPSLVGALDRLADRLVARLVDRPLDDEAWRLLKFSFAERVGRSTGARPLSELSVDRAGDPEDLFEVDGRAYTTPMLFYYLRYAYCCRFTDFETIPLVAELGSGTGEQAEVLRKAHPDLRLCLFDIPPQLYVAHQYLSAVFGDAVAPYRQTRRMTSLEHLEPGGIYLLSAAQFPLLRSARPSLFWSAASFQDLAPPIVANYLATVDGTADAVYLMQQMDGRTSRPGLPGAVEPTTLEDYRRALSSFDLVDLSPAMTPHARPLPRTSDSYWRRRGGGPPAG